MLLTLTCTREPATDLGFLLHKHPEKHQQFALNFGTAHVFYPQASPERCTAALLLDVDPVALVRRGGESALDRYVNDRPYVAGSFFSVAMNAVLHQALVGKCAKRPELPGEPLPLEATVTVVQCRPGEEFLRELFEPLGYTLKIQGHPLDPELGYAQQAYFTLTLAARCPLQQMLNHLYVLLPVLDNDKHYWVGEDELEKLLRRGEGWLAGHPRQRSIVERDLKPQRQLTRDALQRLQEEPEPPPAQKEEEPPRLHEVRLDRIAELLVTSGAKTVLDLGCGGGKLLARLKKLRQFQRLVGMDVDLNALQEAKQRLKWEDGDPRLSLLHGTLVYRDRRLQGFDAAAVVEVIEHLDPARLEAFERNLFGDARPKLVVLSTPNREYNQLFPNLAAGKMRHADHRFEWTRSEFQVWASAVAQRNSYQVSFEPLGEEHPDFGPPTQIGVFTR